MKKKVLILSSFPAPYRVGVFYQMKDYYDMDLFFGADYNENRNERWYSQSGNIFSFSVLGNDEADKKLVVALKNIRKYDFVICYDVYQKPAYIAIILCKLFRIPYFVNCDGAILKKNIFRDTVKRFLYKNASGCFSSGNSARDYYLFYGVPKNKIYRHQFSSLNRADIITTPITTNHKKLIKQEIGIPNKKTVITVGQFIPRKGFDVLIQAWEKVKGDSQLLIIGGGNEKENYEKYIYEKKISNILIFDYLEKLELFKYFKASEIFVLPTREDIWGLVVNEAMANGLPVITTNKCVAGIELIENGKNGYIVNVNDVDSLAEKIQLLLDSDELRDSMQQLNIKLIQDWTIENIALCHINTINNVLGYEKSFNRS